MFCCQRGTLTSGQSVLSVYQSSSCVFTGYSFGFLFKFTMGHVFNEGEGKNTLQSMRTCYKSDLLDFSLVVYNYSLMFSRWNLGKICLFFFKWVQYLNRKVNVFVFPYNMGLLRLLNDWYHCKNVFVTTTIKEVCLLYFPEKSFGVFSESEVVHGCVRVLFV